MTRTRRLRRVVLMAAWRMINPLFVRLARIAPWWVVLETTGRRTGLPRQTPLARGPTSGGDLWLVAVHGRHSSWVANLEADPRVRVLLRGRWYTGRASVTPLDQDRLSSFNRYARSGPTTVGINPLLVRVELSPS
jgi:deazaflavin-dependent oxidoreductase (nitroreductase family)